MKREASTLAKNNPQPIRFDPTEEKLIRDIADDTGLTLAEVVRRMSRFALPKFLSGKANIMKFGRSAKATKAQDGRRAA